MKDLKTMTARIERILLFIGLIAGVLLLLFPMVTVAQKPPTGLALTFIRGGYYDTVVAGEQGTFLLEARNNSTEVINGIVFSAAAPDEWTITFKPQQIDSLSPGNFETVSIVISPPEKTPADTYQVPIRADAGDIHQVITSTVVVETPKGFWWLIGGIVTAVVVAGFIFVYFRFGRR
jgi:uncharacterized membrane protein